MVCGKTVMTDLIARNQAASSGVVFCCVIVNVYYPYLLQHANSISLDIRVLCTVQYFDIPYIVYKLLSSFIVSGSWPGDDLVDVFGSRLDLMTVSLVLLLLSIAF